MINEQPHRTWIVLIVAIIGAAGLIIAAIISLAAPFAERMADKYFPTLTPIVDTNAPTESKSQEVQPTAIIQQAIVPTSMPLQSPEFLPTNTSDPSCMTVTPFREMGKNGETKTFIRCPVGQVQYSIQVDDTLNTIVLTCPNQPDKKIAFAKNELRSASEKLITWDTEPFRSEPGCKVKITITNNYAEMGYTIWQEVIAP